MSKPPETKVLSVDLLRIDAGTQCRISINEETVDDYADVIERCRVWPFEPLDVFHDGNEYLVADGFHRTLAAQRAKRASVPCIIHKGTSVDARIFGMTANDRHGLRMSRADKRSCIEWLIDNGGKLTQDEIASKAGVSLRLVKYVVADRKAEKVQIAPFQGKATKKSSHSISERGKPGGVHPPKDSAPLRPVPANGNRSGEAADSNQGSEVDQERPPGPPRNGKERDSAPEVSAKCPMCGQVIKGN